MLTLVTQRGQLPAFLWVAFMDTEWAGQNILYLILLKQESFVFYFNQGRVLVKERYVQKRPAIGEIHKRIFSIK